MTAESFCKMIWDCSYSTVKSKIATKRYRSISIPKKNGVRDLHFLDPKTDLHMLQSGLISFLKKMELPVCVKGFVNGESYLSYLEQHVGSKHFLRIDIKDFFPSITRELIEQEISCFLSFDSEEEREKIVQLVSDIVTFQDCLPQGAVSSPVVSNIIMIRIDQRILKYCQVLGVKYTRYADDMLFSSEELNFNDKKWFLRKIKHIVSQGNLKINYGKLKSCTREISLNGYVVSQEGIRLSRQRLHDIKKVISFASSNRQLLQRDPNSYVKTLNQLNLENRDLSVYPFKSVYQFYQFLCGYRSYLISFLKHDIESQFRKKLCKLLDKLEKIIKQIASVL